MTISPPTVEFDEAPYTRVTFNKEWISHLIGLIDPASKERYWDTGDEYEATQQIEQIIRALTLGNGAMFPVRKAKFVHSAAQNTAGGTKVANAWTVLPISASFFSSHPSEIYTASNTIILPDGYYRFDANHVFRNANNYVVRTRLVWERGGVIGDQQMGISDTFKIDASPAVNRNVPLTVFYQLTDGTNTVRFEYYSTVSRNSDGLGAAGNIPSQNEHYGSVVIEEVFTSDAND